MLLQCKTRLNKETKAIRSVDSIMSQVRDDEYESVSGVNLDIKAKSQNLAWKKVCAGWTVAILISIVLTVCICFLFTNYYLKTKIINGRSSTKDWMTTSPPGIKPMSPAQRSTKQEQPNIDCMVEAAGHGHKVIFVKKGQPLRQWKSSLSTGGCSLEYMKYLAINATGLYKVYVQVTFYRSPEKSPLGYMLKRNQDIVTKTIMGSCKFMCTKVIMRFLKLKSGDQLSIVSTNDATFYMSPKMSYFGASFVKPDTAI